MATSIEKTQQRVNDLEERLKKAKALKQKQEAAIRAGQAKKDRAADTRRKILVGSIILSRVERGEWSKEKMLAMMGQLTRDDDRALFGMPPLPSKESQNS